MISYAQWLSQRASGANAMELHEQILPCGYRMASEYRALLQDATCTHLHPLIRTRLVELEKALTQLSDARAA